WHPAELFRLRKGNASRCVCDEGLRHLVADGDTDRRVRAGAATIEIFPEPAFAFVAVRIGCRLPDFGRAEVGAIRIRITDALDDGEVAVVEDRFQTSELRIQPGVGIEL